MNRVGGITADHATTMRGRVSLANKRKPHAEVSTRKFAEECSTRAIVGATLSDLTGMQICYLMDTVYLVRSQHQSGTHRIWV